MIAQARAAVSADSKKFVYPSPVVSRSSSWCVAEERGEYVVKKDDENPLTEALVRLEIQARRRAIEGQIARLRGIAELLSSKEHGEVALKQLSVDIEQVATGIEDEVVGLVYSAFEEYESD